MLIPFKMGMTTEIVGNQVSHHSIDQGWQGFFCNQLIRQQQAEEDILNDVFRLLTVRDAAAYKSQQFITVVNVIIVYELVVID